MSVPALRIRNANRAPLKPSGDYVLYWMLAARRPTYNFGLERALELGRELGKPVLVLEALTSGYRWASDRLHQFVIQGMADNQAAFAKTCVHYYPYVEPSAGAGRGLVEALASSAAAVVADDFPCFFLPRLLASVSARLPVRCEAVDGNGILPIRLAEREFARAFDFRRYLAKIWLDHVSSAPKAEPLRGLRLPRLEAAPRDVLRRWPMAAAGLLALEPKALSRLPIDHGVAPSTTPGGHRAAERALTRFCEQRLSGYAEERNHPDSSVTSELSPYLHFGHVSAHDVLARVLDHDELSVADLEPAPSSQKSPFFQLRPGPAAFVDQLITWRELGYNFCVRQPRDHDQYASLPEWARRSLATHATDAREKLYSAAAIEQAKTADPLWNAAQRQLVESGHMHNYLRMLWGKRVLNWTRTPEQAYQLLVELNNKYALDGRNPNSYSGIGWCFGRYDRPWGPERPVYGLIRYMTSESAQRKLHLKQYLQRWGGERKLPGFG
ncbi:MAG: FAD-binding domain-containing protein [Polyangiaceae bacterium]